MFYTLGNNENTAGKSLRVLRTFVNISIRFGYIKSNPFQYILNKNHHSRISDNTLLPIPRAFRQ